MSVRKFREYLFCNLQKLQQKKVPASSYIIFFFALLSLISRLSLAWPHLY